MWIVRGSNRKFWSLALSTLFYTHGSHIPDLNRTNSGMGERVRENDSRIYLISLRREHRLPNIPNVMRHSLSLHHIGMSMSTSPFIHPFIHSFIHSNDTINIKLLVNCQSYLNIPANIMHSCGIDFDDN